MSNLLDKSASRVRRMFGEIAQRYDLLNHLLSLGVDQRWRRRVVQLVPPTDAAPILDVCTGTADLALAYWRGTREPTLIVGADFCRPMLTLARQKLYHAGASRRVRLVEADALRLPFPAGVFQIVTVAFGLRNLSDTAAGLQEMTRVCRPGGRVAILEFALPRWPPLRLLYGLYFRRLLPRVGQALAPNSQGAYNYLPASVGEFPAAEAMVALMESAGLEAVRCHPMSFGIACLYVGHKPGEEARQPIAAMEGNDFFSGSQRKQGDPP